MSTEAISVHRSAPAGTIIIVALLSLLLLATAYFATTAARPMERLDMIPIEWSGDLAV